MGTISGSAVANVAAVGVFTIPLMKQSGVPAERAAATEAIASTGGQLMPPVMGVAAFVMAELLGVPYAQIALAGVIPAIAYYVALYILVDLNARKTGLGTLPAQTVDTVDPVLPRLSSAHSAGSSHHLHDDELFGADGRDVRHPGVLPGRFHPQARNASASPGCSIWCATPASRPPK